MLASSPRTHESLAIDLSIALCPALIWGIFLYGGRAAVLLLLCGLACAALDVGAQLLLMKTGERFTHHGAYHRTFCRTDVGFAFLTGLLCAFWFPVTVPLWLPLLAALPVTLCRAAFCYFGHRVLNSAAFSATLMTVLFPQYMERFTKPFAYFPVFPINLPERLVEAYRVNTPLSILQNEKLYEDGMFAQFYGFASGAIGAVAIACLLLGGVWLLIRSLLSVRVSGVYLLTVMALAMAFAPDNAEMFRYSLLYLLSGGVMLAAVFSLNDPSVLPRTKVGQMLFGLLAGVLTYVFREWLGGMGELYAVAFCPLATPLLEKITKPADYYRTGRRKVAAQ